MENQEEEKRKAYLLKRKIYREKNRERLKAEKLAYYYKNKEHLNQKTKEYQEQNKEAIQEKRKEYLEQNKEAIQEKKKLYRETPEAKKQNKIYREENKETIKERNKEYYNKTKEIRRLKQKERRSNDLLFKLRGDISCLIRNSFSSKTFKKTSKTQDILGCTFEEFRQHIESNFEDWMNWDNRGNWNGIPTELNTAWDIDHIIPTSTATTELELLQLNHYTNLQPLCSYYNRNVKKDNLI
jgi:hypothetical protein